MNIYAGLDHLTVSQTSKNEPVNDEKPAAYLPIVLNNNNNKLSLTVKFWKLYTIVIFVIVKHMCAQLEDLLHILRARFWQNNTRCIYWSFFGSWDDPVCFFMSMAKVLCLVVCDRKLCAWLVSHRKEEKTMRREK